MGQSEGGKACRSWQLCCTAAGCELRTIALNRLSYRCHASQNCGAGLFQLDAPTSQLRALCSTVIASARMSGGSQPCTRCAACAAGVVWWGLFLSGRVAESP